LSERQSAASRILASRILGLKTFIAKRQEEVTYNFRI
jgi:hypothetical protein